MSTETSSTPTDQAAPDSPQAATESPASTQAHARPSLHRPSAGRTAPQTRASRS